MPDTRTDFDSPWKDIIEAYFTEFMVFFFPTAYREIDWAKGYEFLDKELQQVTREAEIGKRLADKLVKAWTLAGDQIWVLIHIEIQSQYEAGFTQRMFVYNYRLRELFNQPVASFAILGDDQPQWRPHTFQAELWDCRTTFEFPSVKLLDYRQQWEMLEASDNPFATVVMAHLKTLETKNDAIERQQWKLNLLKRLYRKGYDRQAIIDLLRFIDWLVILPEALEQNFWQAVLTYQEETRVKYVMSIERFAEERGRQQGIKQGIAKERSLVLRQLNRKLGALPDNLHLQIGDLSPSQLEALGEALLDFAELADCENWLGQLQTSKTEVLQQLIDHLGELDETMTTQVQALPLSALSELQQVTLAFETVAALQDWLVAQAQAEEEDGRNF